MSELLRHLCGLPTAPFHETRVLDAVRDWATARRLGVTADRSGNLLVRRPGRSTSRGW